MIESTLVDVVDGKQKQSVQISIDPNTGIHIYAEGYGGDSELIGLLELANGVLQLWVYADRAQEEPTHKIELSAAKD